MVEDALSTKRFHTLLLCLSLALGVIAITPEASVAGKNCGSVGPWKSVVANNVQCSTARKLARKVPRNRPTGVFGNWRCYGLGGGAECSRKENPKRGVYIGLYHGSPTS